MGAQRLQKPRRRFRRAAVKNTAAHIQHHNAAVLILGNAAQKRIFLAQASEPEADIQRLVDGGVNALHAGGDQKRVQLHFPGDGMGDHVADHHPAAVALDPLQRIRRLLGAVDRIDIQLVPQQIAEGMGRFRDAGESHDGIAAGIIFRQLHGA